MPFSPLIGNPAAKAFLTKLLVKKQIPHALLFSGMKGVGKSHFARALALQLLNTTKIQPPDLHLYAPSGKSALHTMETIHELIAETALAPFEAPVKVFILDDFDRMLPASANALLKTLEEPPQDTYFFLISSEPEQILETLLSRCAKISFFPVPDSEIAHLLETEYKLSAAESAHLTRLAQGSVAKACALAKKNESRAEELIEELFAKQNLSVVKDLEELTPQEEEMELLEKIGLFFANRARKSPGVHSSQVLEKLLPLLEESRLALERHTKLSHVLQFLLLSL